MGGGQSLGSGIYSSGGSFTGAGPGAGTVIEPTPGCGLGSTANDTGCCVGGPETTCGGVGSACLESSGNMVTTTDWSYVGQGRGGYSAAPSYLPTKVTSGLGVTKAIAVGGPVLKGHKLFVTVRSATWDTTPILTGFPSDYTVPGLLDMHYNNNGQLLQAGRSGKPLHIVHIKIEDGSPEGLKIQVNRWMEPTEGDYMNVKINMHKQPDQDGHCGNFNGIPTDDDRIQVRARVGKTGVEPAQMLFHTKTPVMVANRPNINDCPAEKLDDAKSLCKAKKQRETGSKWAIPSMDCLIDVCFGGKGFAQTG